MVRRKQRSAGRDVSCAICLEIAGCESEHTRVRVWVKPCPARQVKGQLPMFDGSMVQLADKTDRDLVPANASNRKTNCIPVALPRKVRTGCCVTQVADFPHVGVDRRELLPRGAAVSRPSRSQWQTRRMRPGAVVHDFPRHKKRASQVGPSDGSIVTQGVI